MPLWRRAFIGSSSRFNEVFARGHMFVAYAATPPRATFHTWWVLQTQTVPISGFWRRTMCSHSHKSMMSAMPWTI